MRRFQQTTNPVEGTAYSFQIPSLTSYRSKAIPAVTSSHHWISTVSGYTGVLFTLRTIVQSIVLCNRRVHRFYVTLNKESLRLCRLSLELLKLFSPLWKFDQVNKVKYQLWWETNINNFASKFKVIIELQNSVNTKVKKKIYFPYNCITFIRLRAIFI